MKKYKFNINGNPFAVTIKSMTDDQALIEVNGSEYHVDIINEPIQRKTPHLIRERAVYDTEKRAPKTKAIKRPAAAGSIKAPLPGLILEILVKPGDEVKIGQQLLKMEAMKMENNIQSNREGKVTSIKVKPGDSVLEGDILVEIGG